MITLRNNKTGFLAYQVVDRVFKFDRQHHEKIPPDRAGWPSLIFADFISGFSTKRVSFL